MSIKQIFVPVGSQALFQVCAFASFWISDSMLAHVYLFLPFLVVFTVHFYYEPLTGN